MLVEVRPKVFREIDDIAKELKDLGFRDLFYRLEDIKDALAQGTEQSTQKGAQL
jgi:hypothetical protein